MKDVVVLALLIAPVATPDLRIDATGHRIVAENRLNALDTAKTMTMDDMVGIMLILVLRRDFLVKTLAHTDFACVPS